MHIKPIPSNLKVTQEIQVNICHSSQWKQPLLFNLWWNENATPYFLSLSVMPSSSVLAKISQTWTLQRILSSWPLLWDTEDCFLHRTKKYSFKGWCMLLSGKSLCKNVLNFSHFLWDYSISNWHEMNQTDDSSSLQSRQHDIMALKKSPLATFAATKCKRGVRYYYTWKEQESSFQLLKLFEAIFYHFL